MTGNGYGALLRRPGLRPWLALFLCQRFPVAMAPLGLVYLGRGAEGSLANGAVLVGTHALAEALTAAPLGRRFDRRPVRREFALVLGAEAVLFGLAVALAGRVPLVVLAALAASAGAVAAGAIGGLRTMVLRLAPGEARAALGLESAAGTSAWMVAPVLVAGLGGWLGPLAPTAVMAGFAALGAVLAFAQREVRPVGVQRVVSGREMARDLAPLFPACAQTAASNLAVGGLTVSLFGLLPLLGVSGDASGVWLTVMAGAGIAAGLGYGARAWPGRAAVQSAVLLGALGLCVAGTGLATHQAMALVLVGGAGALQAPFGAARALAVQGSLPEHTWSVAFSLLYVGAGVGYGIAGLLAAPLIERSGPRAAIVVCAALALVVTGVSAAVELRRRPAVTPRPVSPALAGPRWRRRVTGTGSRPGPGPD
ncbi:MFS transporter [Streptomyces radicis]|uniref:MFS transporter n=1 Tax=Streptomyces radicis TaxID=1750517 RepID=UPI0011C469DA|nr:MFS transporter [Streptomyces radicis]